MKGIGLAFAKLLYSLLHLDTALAFEDGGKRATLRLRGTATFIQLPKLAKTLEKIPSNAELHVDIDDLNYIDHACLDLFETWEEQHKSKGGRLYIEWDALTDRYHKRRATIRALPSAAQDYTVGLPEQNGDLARKPAAG